MNGNRIEIAGGGNKQNKKVIFFDLQMNMFNMFVVFGLALFLCATITQAAPAADVSADATTTATAVNITTPGYKICHYRTPCGWAVYNRISRNIDYFMRNTCYCPEDKVCSQGEDNLSVGAYVYHCEDPPPTRATRRPPTTTLPYYDD